MIEIREAVSKSLTTLKSMDLVPPSSNIELEEAELEKEGDESFWVVTFSYLVPDPDLGTGMGAALASILEKRRS